MSKYRFFVLQPIVGNNLLISDPDLVHQVRNVFRMKAGDEVILLDNSGFEYKTKIGSINKNEISFTVLKKENVSWSPKKDLWLFYFIRN